jgi:acyl-CoA thioester hydrolase
MSSPGTDSLSAQALTPYRAIVQPEWIDYNGHMNVAYYTLVFDRATDALLDHLAIGAAYRQASNRSIYVLEAHTSFRQEVRLGDRLAVASRLLDADEKRLHIFHRMTLEGSGGEAATSELLALHVDLAGPRAAPFDAGRRAAIAALIAAQGHLPRPDGLGRGISLAPRPAP